MGQRKRVRYEGPLAETLRALAKNQPELFLVGGSVRDILLGRDLTDLDLATQAPLEMVARLITQLTGAKAVLIGREPKLVFRFNLDGVRLDLAQAEGGGLARDLARRDFTINAMAMRLCGETEKGFELIDPLNGVRDLAARRLRFVSGEVILADPARLIRLPRFMAELGFFPGPEDQALAARHAALLKKSAPERVQAELARMLEAPSCSPALGLMVETGLAGVVFPELSALDGLTQNAYHHKDALGHTLEMMERLEEIMADPSSIFPGQPTFFSRWLETPGRAISLKLAALLHDTGKPHCRRNDDGQVSFHGHEKTGARLAEEALARLKFPGAVAEPARFIVRHHMRPLSLFSERARLSPKAVYRFGRLAGALAPGLIIHAAADAAATRGPLSARDGGADAIASFFNELAQSLSRQETISRETQELISGRELMSHLGIPSSPLVGQLLEGLREARVLGLIHGRKEALDLAARLAARPEFLPPEPEE